MQIWSCKTCRRRLHKKLHSLNKRRSPQKSTQLRVRKPQQLPHQKTAYGWINPFLFPNRKSRRRKGWGEERWAKQSRSHRRKGWGKERWGKRSRRGRRNGWGEDRWAKRSRGSHFWALAWELRTNANINFICCPFKATEAEPEEAPQEASAQEADGEEDASEEVGLSTSQAKLKA